MSEQLPGLGFVGELAREYRQPVSFVLLLMLSGAVVYLWHDYVSHADLERYQAKSEQHIATLENKMTSLQSSMDSMTYTLNKNHAENDLRDVRKQIFEMQRALAADKDSGRAMTASRELQQSQLSNLVTNTEPNALLEYNKALNAKGAP